MTIQRFQLRWLFLLVPFFLNSLNAFAQAPAMEEIPVSLQIEGLGAGTLNPLYEEQSGKLLLPITELFKFLQIKAEASATLDTISGFMVKEENSYLIDNSHKEIFFNGKKYTVSKDKLINTGTELYLDCSLLGEIFGLYCTFDFRSLSIVIKANFELPVVREMRLKQFRKNMQQLQDNVATDTTLRQQYHLARFGMLDWSVTSTQSTITEDNTQLWLSAGAELLAGETYVGFNYSSLTEITNRNLQYYWHWVNNQSKAIRQIRVGRIAPLSIASIYDPVTGVQVSNASTIYRRSFGRYTIANYTQPGWTVELYVNNVIVDYQTADASGFYRFNVPLVYGASEVMLKFYGPYGEERIQRQFLNIPFNFLPRGQLEYNVNYGIVSDDRNSVYGRAEAKYGMNRYVTLGSGIEYLSSIHNKSEIPFVNASVSPFRNLLITGEYANGVQTKALASYQLPSGPSFELNYVRYVSGQQAVFVSYLEDRKATLSFPLRFSKLNAYVRMSYGQNVYEMFTYNNADFTFSSFIGNISTNISAYANWINGQRAYIYSNLGAGLPVWKGFTTRLQSQIDISKGNVISVRGEIEKHIFREGYISLVGEGNFQMNYAAATLSFRWTLPFSQVSLSNRVAKNEFTTIQAAQGSLAFASGKGFIHAEDRPSVRTGGISVIPFIDINHNNKRDKGEPLTTGLTVKMNSGRSIPSTDSIIRIVGLEPYTSYVVTLDDKGLEQISYRIIYKNLRVFIEPNQFKKIEVPILPMGEVNGWVLEKNTKKGEERIVVNFYSEAGKLIATTLTERDGAFTYLGLPPGRYYAQLDATQLSNLGINVSPQPISFEIKPNVLGDIVYDLQFFIEPSHIKE